MWIVTRLSLSPNRAARRDDVLVEEDKDKTERGERGRCTMADRDGDAEANEGEKGQRAREREEKKGERTTHNNRLGKAHRPLFVVCFRLGGVKRLVMRTCYIVRVIDRQSQPWLTFCFMR